MTKSKTTRKALVVSVCILMLCVAVLIGSTFAWFTDSASTSVNTIQAGTLEIQLLDAAGNNLEGQTLSFKKAAGAEAEDILWEPGCTYDLPEVFVKNNGNLALKYKIEVTGINGDAKLGEAIEWTIGNADAGTEYHLAKGATSDAITISGHMKETAGNEYQGLAINGVAINVIATQDTVEHDSYDDQYDADATYPVAPVVVSSQTELADVIANTEAGEAVAVVLPEGTFEVPSMGASETPKDITISGSEDTVIDLTESVGVNGANFTFDGVTIQGASSSYTGIQHSGTIVYNNCTIKGMITNYAEDVEFIGCTFENTSDYCIWTYVAKNATFTNCTFNTGGKAILIYNEITNSNFVANVTLNNCTFNDDGSYTSKVKAAVETGTNGGNTATSNKYNIKFNGCTVNGFEPNNSTSNLWGNKDSMDTAHLDVVIDGTNVY